jgi:hypothetical protein
LWPTRTTVSMSSGSSRTMVRSCWSDAAYTRSSIRVGGGRRPSAARRQMVGRERRQPRTGRRVLLRRGSRCSEPAWVARAATVPK